MNSLEIQQESFFHFINIGLQTEFKNSQIWFQTSIWERVFYSENLCFEVPTQNYQESIRNNKTYSTHIFIIRLVYDFQNKKIYFEWRILGNIPILTQYGHFIVNGSYRVCIIQIIRGSGVYGSRKINDSKKIIFYIDFVPKKGIWVRLEKDFKNLIWFCIQTEFCRIIDWVLYTINESVYLSEILKNSVYNYKSINVNFLTKTCKLLNLTSDYFRNQKIEILYLTQKFSNFLFYDTGEQGRKNINKRFNQKIPMSLRCLIPTDFIRAILELKKLSKRKTTRRFDDFDNLRIRRLYRIGHLLRQDLKQIIFQIEQKACRRLNLFLKNYERNVIQLIFIVFFNSRIHRFININPLFQFVDNLNPLVDITQKRRLTGLGIGGLTLSTRNKKVRNIHKSHFGRLCLVETPDSKNAGIVTFLRMIRQFSDDKIVQSMTFKKYKSWLQNISEKIRLKPLVFVWKSKKKRNWTTQFSIGLLIDILGKFRFCRFEIILEMGVNNFYLIYNMYIKIISSLAIQVLALSPNLIPFLQNNDANRVLMGATMLRQSLSTMKFLFSRISSGVDIFIRNGSGQNLYVFYSGIVMMCTNVLYVFYTNIFKSCLCSNRNNIS